MVLVVHFFSVAYIGYAVFGLSLLMVCESSHVHALQLYLLFTIIH